jgi:hypothetical protein
VKGNGAVLVRTGDVAIRTDDRVKGRTAWPEGEGREATDGTPRCVLCGCDCEERVDDHSLALCLNQSVMVERMFSYDPGWKAYDDRDTAMRTIIKMLSGTGGAGTEHRARK